MPWKTALVAAAAILTLAAGPGLHGVSGARAQCEPGVKIDKSTAEDARKQIEAAGYSHVRELRKGCDNIWHAKAMKDGTAVSVALLPQGRVMPEAE